MFRQHPKSDGLVQPFQLEKQRAAYTVRRHAHRLQTADPVEGFLRLLRGASGDGGDLQRGAGEQTPLVQQIRCSFHGGPDGRRHVQGEDLLL